MKKFNKNTGLFFAFKALKANLQNSEAQEQKFKDEIKELKAEIEKLKTKRSTGFDNRAWLSSQFKDAVNKHAKVVANYKELSNEHIELMKTHRKLEQVFAQSADSAVVRKYFGLPITK